MGDAKGSDCEIALYLEALKSQVSLDNLLSIDRLISDHFDHEENLEEEAEE